MNDRTTLVTRLSEQELKHGMRWLPVQGEQSTGVADRGLADQQGRESLIQSAAQILGSGIDPQNLVGTATGLIVGYVQSGKTLSFTTVIGLARDNGFPIVIVVASNKDPLLTQSHQRLARDLDVDGGEGLPAWRMAKNPRSQDGQYEQLLRQTIENWRDPALDDDEKPTLLLTVLKQNQRLGHLTTLLRSLDLARVPALVIDDEADQASLNTKVNQAQESTTYTRLRELRDALPSHTYLQYTATPQALLLVNIADTLSPDFVHVLEPGTDYAGGADFFQPRTPYVKVIPANDVQAIVNLTTDPPETLLQAMRVFFVGLAASSIMGRGRRSMLIHPDRLTIAHQRSVQWATAARDRWKETLAGPTTDPDYQELIQEFRTAYDELTITEEALPQFDVILERLPRSLRNTTVIEFNTRGRPKAPEITWRHAEGWILVGGQAVDRGFTVDSLTVTYMPRSVGVGNADTLQQRARFFGYKRSYLGICRVYLERALRDAYIDYVEHEQFMRKELQRIASEGGDLASWRRRLVLDPTLHPCRRSVISDPYTRATPGGGWTLQRGALMTPETRDGNDAILKRLMDECIFEADTTYVSREVAQQHQVAREVSLRTVVEALVDYRLEDPRDTASFTGMLVSLGEALQREPNLVAAVYHMRPSAFGERTIANDGSIDTWQQGRTALSGGGVSYPGDTFFKMSDRLSIQLHRFNLKKRSGEVVARSAPLIAFHIPAAIAKAWLVQIQGGQ